MHCIAGMWYPNLVHVGKCYHSIMCLSTVVVNQNCIIMIEKVRISTKMK